MKVLDTPTGEEVVPFIYDDAHPLSVGLALVCYSGFTDFLLQLRTLYLKTGTRRDGQTGCSIKALQNIGVARKELRILRINFKEAARIDIQFDFISGRQVSDALCEQKRLSGKLTACPLMKLPA